ncbi:hypothetical protein PMI42_04880 [Bradyrhizobium sp. YR681]|uniref:hypothetical protein n=1 Tax=Bradyrhizobium sp. YR681 TaxID=1144344 RepID=UPI000271149D|nr:hypothetical protein [Bradyrhizobium sp. YR681]EJN11865.1 hypothetical protein PMI42_04880 [Bradyrhizobium sp. YR681]
MTGGRRGAWLALALVVFVSLFMFQRHVGRYPYYALDDMDQLTALDVLLIRGGTLPDHVTHPTAGMYVFLTLTHRIGYLLGLLHLHDFRFLDHWANPLLGTAELIDFLRAHLPFLAIGSSLLLALAVTSAVGAGPWMVIIIFLCIAVSRALAFHTIIFRTDSFALFYAAAAASLAVWAVQRRGWVAVALAVCSGIAGGFAFTSKLTIVPTVALAPALVLFMMVRRDQAFTGAFHATRRFNAIVCITAVAVYVVLLGLSQIPMASTFIHTRISFHNYALCAAALLAIAGPGIATRILPERSVFYRFFSFANLMALGFTLSFLALWFVMLSPSGGVRFVAALARICFLGVIDPALAPGYAGFWEQVSSSPFLLLPPLVLFLLLGILSLASLRELGALTVIGLLVVVSILWFDRMIIHQDGIYTEPLLLALFGLMLSMAWPRGGLPVRAIAAVCVVILLARGAAQGEISELMDAGYAGYFKESRQIMTPYQTGNQQQIQDALGQALVRDSSTGHVVSGHARELIYAQAADYREVATRVSYVVPNLGRIDWSRIGVLGEGLKPFGQTRRELWFTSVPRELEGAIIYTPPDDRVERPGADWLRMILTYCGLYDQEIDAWVRSRTEMIRPRSDMNVLVFVPADKRESFALSPTAPIVGTTEHLYVGVVVPINAPGDLLRRLKLESDRFVVIGRRFG